MTLREIFIHDRGPPSLEDSEQAGAGNLRFIACQVAEDKEFWNRFRILGRMQLLIFWICSGNREVTGWIRRKVKEQVDLFVRQQVLDFETPIDAFVGLIVRIPNGLIDEFLQFFSDSCIAFHGQQGRFFFGTEIGVECVINQQGGERVVRLNPKAFLILVADDPTPRRMGSHEL